MSRTREFRGEGDLGLDRPWFSPEARLYALDRDGHALFWADDDLAAVVASPGVDRALDPAALVEEAVLAFPTGTRTPFAAVRRVPWGGRVKARRGPGGRLEVEVEVTASPPPGAGDGRGLEERLLGAVSAALEEGGAVLLSGGVDSTLLAVMASRAAGTAGGRVFALTAVGEGEAARADCDSARRVAENLGLGLEEVAADPGGPPLKAWADLVLRTASPRPPSGGIAAAARAVRGAAPRLLCGEGADELFAGYWWVYPHPHLYVEGLKRRFSALAGAWGDGAVPGSQGLERRLQEWEGLGRGELFRELYELNLCERLPNLHLYQARAEGAPTPVVFPYLDPGVAGFARARTPAELVGRGVTKRPLRELAGRLLPGGLGELVATRDKVGLPEAASGLRARVVAAAERLPGLGRDSHPLGWLYPGPLERYTADLFLFLFYCHGGLPPDGFDPAELYQAFDRDRAWREAAPGLVMPG